MIYLSPEDVLPIHAEAVGCSEAEAGRRLLSLAGLEGAVARPIWYARFVDPDVPYLAAVLAHGLAEGKVFVDGNKRTAFLAMAVFLDRNGYELRGNDAAMAEWIIALSSGGSIEDLAEKLSGAVRPIAHGAPE